MTNQKVVVSDAKSGIGMTINGSPKNSSLFSANQPPAAAGATIWRKKPLKKLETGGCGGGGVGGTRVVNGNWVDSMRASSPTRKPSSPFSETDQDYTRNSWIVRVLISLSFFFISPNYT